MTDCVKPMILMADDDEDDCLLARNAFEQVIPKGSFFCVEGGDELLEYLFDFRKNVTESLKFLPDLILLDLNMPRKDGREVLREIKSIPEFRNIPIVVLTTSREERDVAFSREMGAESLITKPERFDLWLKMMTSLAKRWLN